MSFPPVPSGGVRRRAGRDDDRNSPCPGVRLDTLLEEYQAGAWVPTPEEQDFADDLARVPWNTHLLRAGLRELPCAVRDGRLVSVLDPAVQLMDLTDADAGVDDALLRLWVLIDVLTAAPRPAHGQRVPHDRH